MKQVLKVIDMIFFALVFGILIIAIVAAWLISKFAGVQQRLDDEQN